MVSCQHNLLLTKLSNNLLIAISDIVADRCIEVALKEIHFIVVPIKGVFEHINVTVHNLIIEVDFALRLQYLPRMLLHVSST